MRTTDTIVIGAGQAGLAMSHCLTEFGVDHVVLERGRLAERWRSERWDSLRLLTPNWMTRLPGWQYDGEDLDGFMTAGELVDEFARYASTFDAPIEEHSAVESLRWDDDEFEVVTTAATWRARHVVIATGWCDIPAIPTMSHRLARDVHQVAPSDYRNPSSLPDGGVLVVGASATGVQLADELRRAGRDVVLAVGSHSRLPRRYRGMDVYWWLDRIGTFDRTIDDVADAARARREPSLQLVGRPDGRRLDLGTLQRSGVRLAGRLGAANGRRVRFHADLDVTIALAERRMARVLADIDAHIEASGLAGEVLAPDAPPGVEPSEPLVELDLVASGITSVVWATGYRRSYPWLRIPVLDADGEIRQRRGVTKVSGLYVLGQRFQHFRSSNFIGGVGRDATFVADHLVHRACRSMHP
jgi:putative flavoprotein involved in K+ transport